MIKVYLICFMLYIAGFVAARHVAGPELRRDMGWPLLAVLLFLLGLTLLHPTPLAMTMIYPVGMVVGVRTRLDAACRFVLLSVLTIPFTAPVTIGSLYLLRFSTQGGLTLGLLAMVLALPERRPTELRRLPFAPFLVWMAFGITALGYDRIYTATNLSRNISTGLLDYVLPFYLISTCLSRKGDVRRLFGCFIGGAVALAPYALFEARLGWAPVDAITAFMGVDVGFAKSSVVRGGLLRASATFSTTLAFAMFMSLAFIAALAFRDRLRSTFHWRVSVAAIAFGLLLAQSRGSWVMLAVAAVMFYALSGRLGRLLGVAAAAGIAFLLLLAASAMSPQVAAFLGVNESAGGQITDYRQLLFSRGIEEGMKAPILGQDISVVTEKLSDIRQGQGIIDFVNTYLNFFLGAGFVGLIPFLTGEVALLAAISIEARRRRTDPAFQRELLFVGTAFGGVMVFLFFDSLFDRVPILLVMLLAAAKKETNATPAASRPREHRRGLRHRAEVTPASVMA